MECHTMRRRYISYRIYYLRSFQCYTVQSFFSFLPLICRQSVLSGLVVVVIVVVFFVSKF
jgi:hypothetical protein